MLFYAYSTQRKYGIFERKVLPSLQVHAYPCIEHTVPGVALMNLTTERMLYPFPALSQTKSTDTSTAGSSDTTATPQITGEKQPSESPPDHGGSSGSGGIRSAAGTESGSTEGAGADTNATGTAPSAVGGGVDGMGGAKATAVPGAVLLEGSYDKELASIRAQVSVAHPSLCFVSKVFLMTQAATIDISKACPFVGGFGLVIARRVGL